MTKRESEALPSENKQTVKQAGSGARKAEDQQDGDNQQNEEGAQQEGDDAPAGLGSPLAKKKVKLAIDNRRSTLPEKEFSETFDNILTNMPSYIKERVMMRHDHQMPSKSLERPSYVGLYAHEFRPTKIKDAKYREVDNVAGKDANYQ